jgi:hypothetical protein
MTQNYEHTNGSENPDVAAWAELGKESGPVHLDLSTLDFSNIRETYSKVQDPSKAVEVEFSDTTQEIKTTIKEEDVTGRVETVNTANPGDAIVTGKKGERYVVSAEDFGKLYEPLTDENGVITDGRYLPKNVVKCMKNPTGQEIIIDAPWGGDQTGGADCMIVESQINGDRYLIEIGAFEMTYEKNNPTAESNDKE